MRPLSCAAACALIFPCLFTIASEAQAASSKARALDVDLYKRLAADTGNFMISAPSLKDALGIVYLGARGKTAKEMAAVLGFSADASAEASALKKDEESWKTSAGGAELAIANRLWVDSSAPLEAGFVEKVNAAWEAGVESIDFMKGWEPSRDLINAWVAKQTRDKISTLLEKGSITSETRLVIANAIYFNGKWSSSFPLQATRDRDFYVDGKDAQAVPTMFQASNFRFASFDGGEVLELPYAKSSLAMDLFLPDDNAGLAKLESRLSSGAIASWTKKLVKQHVAVTLPKFSFSSGGSLSKLLQEMGMKESFTSRADFSGATSHPSGLQVTDVIQKTWIAVDEVGTEATGATGVVGAKRNGAPGTVHFDIDHPFIFAIRDTKTGKVLFLGRVTNPKRS